MNLQVGVKILISNENGKFLFLRRSHQVESTKHKLWDLPGGRIYPQESLHEALKREVKEETNLELLKVDRLLGAQDIFVKQKDLHVVRLTYEGKASGEVSLSDEHEEFKWASKNELISSGDAIDSYLSEVI